MTPFALLVNVCGLSPGEAATLLGEDRGTVDAWIAGRSDAPPSALAELSELEARIERAANAMAAAIRNAPAAAEIEVGYAVDDAEARQLGWPCCGTQRAALGRAIARAGRPVKLVPRGSTPATAGAADAHGR